MSHGSLNESTALEMLMKCVPNASKLRIFASAAHINVRIGARNNKLGSRSKMWILVGVENGLYCIRDTTSRCLLASRHVVMNKTELAATVEKTQTTSATDGELDENQVLYLYGEVNENEIDDDKAAQDASDVSSCHP